MELYIFIVGKNVYANVANSIHFSTLLSFQQSPPPVTELELAFSTFFAVGTRLYSLILTDGEVGGKHVRKHSRKEFLHVLKKGERDRETEKKDKKFFSPFLLLMFCEDKMLASATVVLKS